MIADILTDALFAAIAGIGFGAISDPPLRAFPYIALLAAAGHALRFCLMTYFGMDIAVSSLISALLIGFNSLWIGGKIYCPMTVFYIPALLPMIPGKIAYSIIFSLIMFFKTMDMPDEQAHYLGLFLSNGLVSLTVIFLLAIGSTFPMFLFPKKAFSLTRHKS